MSTKIYYAYRIKPGNDPWKTLMDIKKKGQWVAKNKLKAMYEHLYSNYLNSEDFRKKYAEICKYVPQKVSQFHMGDYVYKLYSESQGKLTRGVMDLDVSLGVWKHGRSYYLIPYCNDGLHGTLEFLNKDDRLEEYGYWNNTDRPDHVTAKEWDVRRRAWSAIIDKWSECMTLEIVCFTGFDQVNPAIDYLREAWTSKKKA